jgi:hypothetical protein
VRSETLEAVEGIVHALLLVEEDIAKDLCGSKIGRCTEMERKTIDAILVTVPTTYIRIEERRMNEAAP